MIAEKQIIDRLADHATAEKRTYYGVAWDAYLRLLDELGDGSRLRLTYADGVLDVMSPKARHEKLSRMVDAIVTQLAALVGAEFLNCGAVTMHAAGVKRGGEPDSCYYIQNEPLVRDADDLDFSIHPPPDIVLEIDIASPSLDKLELYRALGVPEVWRCDAAGMSFYRLDAGGYVPVTHSLAFPALSAQALMRLLRTGRSAGSLAMLRSLPAELAAS